MKGSIGHSHYEDRDRNGGFSIGVGHDRISKSTPLSGSNSVESTSTQRSLKVRSCGSEADRIVETKQDVDDNDENRIDLIAEKSSKYSEVKSFIRPRSYDSGNVIFKSDDNDDNYGDNYGDNDDDKDDKDDAISDNNSIFSTEYLHKRLQYYENKREKIINLSASRRLNSDRSNFHEMINSETINQITNMNTTSNSDDNGNIKFNSGVHQTVIEEIKIKEKVKVNESENESEDMIKIRLELIETKNKIKLFEIMRAEEQVEKDLLVKITDERNTSEMVRKMIEDKENFIMNMEEKEEAKIEREKEKEEEESRDRKKRSMREDEALKETEVKEKRRKERYEVEMEEWQSRKQMREEEERRRDEEEEEEERRRAELREVEEKEEEMMRTREHERGRERRRKVREEDEIKRRKRVIEDRSLKILKMTQIEDEEANEKYEKNLEEEEKEKELERMMRVRKDEDVIEEKRRKKFIEINLDNESLDKMKGDYNNINNTDNHNDKNEREELRNLMLEIDKRTKEIEEKLPHILQTTQIFCKLELNPSKNKDKKQDKTNDLTHSEENDVLMLEIRKKEIEKNELIKLIQNREANAMKYLNEKKRINDLKIRSKSRKFHRTDTSRIEEETDSDYIRYFDEIRGKEVVTDTVTGREKGQKRGGERSRDRDEKGMEEEKGGIELGRNRGRGREEKRSGERLGETDIGKGRENREVNENGNGKENDGGRGRDEKKESHKESNREGEIGGGMVEERLEVELNDVGAIVKLLHKKVLERMRKQTQIKLSRLTSK